MIKRINLIEKKALSFTYQSLFQIFLVVALIMGALGGYQFLRYKINLPKVDEEKARLESLKADRQSLMATPTKKRVNIGEFQGLLDQLDSVPLWSKLIKEVSQNLPNSVWMTNIKSLVGGTEPAVAKIANPVDNPSGTPQTTTTPQKAESKRIEISGVSVDVKSVAEFLTKLEKTPMFSNVTLISSQKESYGYQFIVQGDVILSYAR